MLVLAGRILYNSLENYRNHSRQKEDSFWLFICVVRESKRKLLLCAAVTSLSGAGIKRTILKLR